MVAIQQSLVTEEEYLRLERVASFKSEYIAGEVVAMSGASARHNLIAANLVRELGTLLAERPCLVLQSDQRVYVPSTKLYAYPDVTVVCERPRMHERDDHTLLNPLVLVEVLSPSTAAYDRGAKFAHYRNINSLRGYLIVESETQRIESFHRLDSGQWLFSEATIGALEIKALEVSLSVAAVYAKVELLGDAGEAAQA